MEIYTFVQMGGTQEKMIVKPIHDDDDDLNSKLSQFDAAKAQCFLPQDRDKLCAPAIRDGKSDAAARPNAAPDSHIVCSCRLAVVEASFGNFRPFNKHVRTIFAAKAEEEKAALARKKVLQKKVRLVQAVSKGSSSAAPAPASAPLEAAAEEAI